MFGAGAEVGVPVTVYESSTTTYAHGLSPEHQLLSDHAAYTHTPTTRSSRLRSDTAAPLEYADRQFPISAWRARPRSPTPQSHNITSKPTYSTNVPATFARAPTGPPLCITSTQSRQQLWYSTIPAFA